MLNLMNAAAALRTGVIPPTDPELPPGVSNNVGTILGWLQGGGLVVCVAGLILGAAMLIVRMRGGDGAQEMASRLVWPCVGAIIIGAASAIIGTFA